MKTQMIQFIAIIALISFLVETQSSAVETTEYQSLMSCYNPGMLVTQLDSTLSKCTDRVRELSLKTKDPEKLLMYTDIVSSVHSQEKAIPFLDRALKFGKTKVCGSMNMQFLMLSFYQKGKKEFLKKCQPLEPSVVVGLFANAREDSLRKDLCKDFAKEIKKSKMQEVCDLLKSSH